MISTTDRVLRDRGVLGALALSGCLSLAGCARDGGFLPAEPVAAPLEAGLVLSAEEAGVGDTIALRVRVARRDAGPLAMAQGVVEYDPARLAYLGQPLTGDMMVMVGTVDESLGRLRFVSLRLDGMPADVADLRFTVRQPGYASTLGYRHELAATRDGEAFREALALPPVLGGAVDGTAPARLGVTEWAVHLGYLAEPAGPRIMLAPGDGAIYGDVTFNGAINGLDQLHIASLSVGNRPLITDATKDYVVAGNVAPANSPDLGEFFDPIPPGLESDGSRIINGLDVLEVANVTVGISRPVAGQAIPGRTPRPQNQVLTGTLVTDLTLFRNTVYELQGPVIVGPGVTLTIEAGTRIEGDPATRGALIVARAGNISWRGTLLEPIVFTCKGATKTPGCWGGIVLNGLALLNHRDPGTVGFCPEKFSIGTTELYGGCLVQDTTGVMQYVRIEHAGQAVPSGGPVAGLSLLGVGSGTLVENVQVHGSLGDGIYVSGGNVNLRNIVLTGNAQAGLHWDHGWGGNDIGGQVQFLHVQVPQNGGDAIRGSNLVGNPNAGPRSEPDLYNVTLTGAGPSGGAGRGWLLEEGSAGTLRDAIILNTSGAGWDVQGPEACAQVSGGAVGFDHNIVFGNAPDYAADADCVDEAAFATTPTLQNRVVDPVLVAGLNTLTPDIRPATNSPAGTGAVPPPSNQFFQTTVTYVGASPVANLLGTNIPWFSGWTRGWSGPTP